MRAWQAERFYFVIFHGHAQEEFASRRELEVFVA